MAKILLVEDDLELSTLIKTFLVQNDFDVNVVDRGDNAIYRITRDDPDLVILDIMLPAVDGIQVCRTVRQQYSGTILMLTAREDDDSHIEGLTVGADDYLHKPIDPKVLLAHINMHLKRGRKHNNDLQTITHGDLSIDQGKRIASLKNTELEFSHKEFDLLCLLAINAGHILSRNNISQVIRGIDHDGFDRSIDLSISHLRKKLGDNPEKPFRIKTVWGKGYLFVPDAWGDA